MEVEMGTTKPNVGKGVARKRSRRRAAEMAARESEERAKRKRRLIKGPREFRDVRGDLPKTKI